MTDEEAKFCAVFEKGYSLSDAGITILKIDAPFAPPKPLSKADLIAAFYAKGGLKSHAVETAYVFAPHVPVAQQIDVHLKASYQKGFALCGVSLIPLDVRWLKAGVLDQRYAHTTTLEPDERYCPCCSVVYKAIKGKLQ